MFNAHSGNRHTHTHTPLLHPPSDAILITSLRFDLSPPDQMADVFILEGDEMRGSTLRSVIRKERRTSVLEDAGDVCLSTWTSDDAKSGRSLLEEI